MVSNKLIEEFLHLRLTVKQISKNETIKDQLRNIFTNKIHTDYISNPNLWYFHTFATPFKLPAMV